MKMGLPPTDLKARTGELTPPGINFFAFSKSSADLVSVGMSVNAFLIGRGDVEK
jgi:hypothetical protein